MQMTEDEIVRSYRNAKNRNTQITVLAQLNACQKEEIEQILERKGELKKKKTEIVLPNMPELVKEMITIKMIEITEQIDRLGEELKELNEFMKAYNKKEDE